MAEDTLLAAQRAFAAALRSPSALPMLASRLSGDPALAARRFATYRANVAASAARALAAAYPVAQQVVGEEFFDALARAHLAAHPSRSGDLHEHGAEFADFVATFPHTQSLPWLPDLARLEWALHCAYGAADAEPVDPAALAAVPPERQAGLRFALAAGTAVVESAWPVLHVWQLHQPGAELASEVDWSVSERALVAREGWQVTATALDAGEAAFMRAVLARDPFSAAAEAAFAASPAFDLGRLLGRLVAAGLVTGLNTSEES